MSDIGQILFVDILKMSSYPGSPFSGNIVNDMVMFLFIPTVIIILFIYVIMQRLRIGNASLRLLFGLAIYAYIIIGGFYQAFALAVGPYFLILIFVLGLFYFITAHFRVGGHSHGSTVSQTPAQYENMGLRDLRIERERIEKQIKFITKELNEASRSKNQERIEQLRQDRVRLNSELEEIKEQLNLVKRPFRGRF